MIKFKACGRVRALRRGPTLQIWSRTAASQGCKRGQSPGCCAVLPEGRNVGFGSGKRLCQFNGKKTALLPLKNNGLQK